MAECHVLTQFHVPEIQKWEWVPGRLPSRFQDSSWAELNGKVYVWSYKDLYEFDPDGQSWKNTDIPNRDFRTHVCNIGSAGLGNCIYTFVASQKYSAIDIVNVETKQRTTHHMNDFDFTTYHPEDRSSDDMNLVAYNGSIYGFMFRRKTVMRIYKLVDGEFTVVRTIGNMTTKFWYNSCSTSGNLVYFYQHQYKLNAIIRVFNMESLKWSVIHLKDEYKQLPFSIRDFYCIGGVFYGLWRKERLRLGMIMLEPNPSLLTRCLITLANHFTKDPIVREKMKTIK